MGVIYFLANKYWFNVLELIKDLNNCICFDQLNAIAPVKPSRDIPTEESEQLRKIKKVGHSIIVFQFLLYASTFLNLPKQYICKWAEIF